MWYTAIHHSPCPQRYCWNSWKNATQVSAILRQLTSIDLVTTGFSMPGLAGRKPASSGLCSESLVHSPAKPPWSQLTSQVGAGCGSQVTWALPHWKVPRQPRVQRVLFCALQPKVLPCGASRRQQKPRQGQGHRRLERSWLVVGCDQRGRAGDSRARTPQRSAGAAPCTCRAA